MTQTINIGPYGYVNITPGDSVAVTAGNVPHLFLKTGSDAIRMPMGHCVNPQSNYLALVNPYPREARFTLQRGLPPNLLHESNPNLYQEDAIASFGSVYKTAEVSGQKWAFGAMLKRGKALIEPADQQADGFSTVMIFPGARPDFLSFKPAGCMEEGLTMREATGKEDDAIFTVAGRYTDAHVSAWVSAAGYSGQITTGPFSAAFNGRARYVASTDTAVFFVRSADKMVNVGFRLWHLGADISEFM